jgi:hypothetical protein
MTVCPGVGLAFDSFDSALCHGAQHQLARALGPHAAPRERAPAGHATVKASRPYPVIGLVCGPGGQSLRQPLVEHVLGVADRGIIAGPLGSLQVGERSAQALPRS